MQTRDAYLEQGQRVSRLSMFYIHKSQEMIHPHSLKLNHSGQILHFLEPGFFICVNKKIEEVGSKEFT